MSPTTEAYGYVKEVTHAGQSPVDLLWEAVMPPDLPLEDQGKHLDIVFLDALIELFDGKRGDEKKRTIRFLAETVAERRGQPERIRYFAQVLTNSINRSSRLHMERDNPVSDAFREVKERLTRDNSARLQDVLMGVNNEVNTFSNSPSLGNQSLLNRPAIQEESSEEV